MKTTIISSRIILGILHLFNQVQVINPNSTAKVLWDCIVLQVLLLQMIYIPLKIGFQLNIVNSMFDVFMNKLPFIILTLEIFLNFKTAYYSHGILILDKREIAQHYLQSRFVIDIINLMIFSFRYTENEFIPEYLEVFVLFRMTRIKVLIENFEETLNLRENFSTIIDVLRLVAMFLFISHLFACSWHFLATVEIKYGYQDTWVQSLELVNREWYIRYCACIYWSQITMLTIGYGDVHAFTEIEQIFVVFVALISSIVFGYTISNIEQIFSSIEETKKKQKHKLSIITSFMRKRNLNKTLSMKVKKFFEYYFRLDHDHDNECEEMMNSLAQNLRYEVKIDFYKKYFRNCKLFKQTFSDQFINKICMITKEKMFLPEQTIFNINEPISEFYFIIKGEVDLLTDNKKQEVKTASNRIRKLHSGYTIGERFFFTEENSTYIAKSQTFTTIAYFNKDEFNKLLIQDQNEWQKFQQSKTKLLMNDSLSGCELCMRNHSVFKCPFVFYQPLSNKVVNRQSQSQNRELLQRRIKLPYRTLLYKEEGQEAAILFGIKEAYYEEVQIDDSFINRYDLGFLKSKQYFDQTSLDFQMASNINIQNQSEDSIKENEKNEFQENNPQIQIGRTEKHQNSLISHRRGSISSKRRGLRQQTLIRNLKQKVEDTPKGISSIFMPRVESQEEQEEEEGSAVDHDQKENQKRTLTTQNWQTSQKLIVSHFLQSLSFYLEHQLLDDYLQIYKLDSLPELDSCRSYCCYYIKWNLDVVLEDVKKNATKMCVVKNIKQTKGFRKNILSLNSFIDQQKLKRTSLRKSNKFANGEQFRRSYQ